MLISVNKNSLALHYIVLYYIIITMFNQYFAYIMYVHR